MSATVKRSRAQLDKIDRAILHALQADGRITNVDLAAKVGITAPPCLRRVRAMEDAGIIQGYHADISGAALGYEVTAFALVSLKGQAESDLARFQQTVADWPMVRGCWMLAGEADFMLKVVAEDFAAWQSFIDRLTAVSHVDGVKSMLTLRTAKDAPGVPIPEP